MIDEGKKAILGVLVDAVDYAAAVDKVISAARSQSSMAVSALAVHGVMSGVLDATLRYRLNHLDLVVPDGQPVRWALNSLYRTRLPERVYGPSLMLRVCERAAQEGLGVYLFGSHAAVLESLCRNLKQRIPNLIIAGSRPSLFRRISAEEKQELVDAIRSSGAAIAFVGLGCPKQETWVYEYRDDLSMPLLGVGAAFDFHAGTLPQAPPWMQRAGLEWLFRLAHEPRRLWRRYLPLNPLFIALFLLQAAGIKRLDPAKATPPAQEMRFG